ncbi:ubiquitin-specific protease ubp2 [Hypoxylon texense]
MAPGYFATYERLPQWAVCKLEGNEDFTTASIIPLVFSTAIYGLIYRADLQHGESVLIHSAAGGLAKHIGTEIFATVGNGSKKAFLVKEFGLGPARIFNSRDSSFLPAIMEATDGQGVDVVLNSLPGELLRSSFEACANFGRFVEIGKRDILDNGLLDMATFGKSVSFIVFDLSILVYSQEPGHHELWHKLLVESMKLVRDGIAKPTDCICVKPPRYESTFSPDKSYLMVGCLGGLGRSISKWMVSRGATSLVHNALEKDGRDSLLDFFIVTSSVSGTVGTATESNYCAANSLLDAFASYRNSIGRPAVSIGYGMIAERKGIHSITEDELLQILDLAITRQSPSTWAPHYDSLVGAHILTGIEFAGLKEQRNRGFEGGNQVLADPRASLLAAAFGRSTRNSDQAIPPIGHSLLPPEVAKVLVSGGSTLRPLSLTPYKES